MRHARGSRLPAFARPSWRSRTAHATAAGSIASSAIRPGERGASGTSGAARAERALAARLEHNRERLAGRVRFILGVVTGDNRRALGSDGEPIVTGRDVAPMRIATPRRHLCVPLGGVQQAAPRAAYARDK